MEILLHYIWKHRIYPLHEMRTNKNEIVEVIDPGLHNSNAGPDFFNAKVKVDGVLWVGNVEIHDKASDWFLHRHDMDEAYDNVILHVVGVDDMPVVTSRGDVVRQMQMDVPDYVKDNYAALLREDKFPPCHNIIQRLSELMIHSWMSALQTERLERKTEAILGRLELSGNSFENAYFMTLARNFGFGVNSEAFEAWAHTLSLQSVAHHRDDIFQVEAIFLGQAGLLQECAVPEKHREETKNDSYYNKLVGEYKYLAHKFGLKEIDPHLWKYMRLRPQNFPHIRISQLANLYYNRSASLSHILDCQTADDVRKLFSTRVTPYWESHYSFGRGSRKSAKNLSSQSIDLIILNTVIPVLFAYGRYLNDEKFCGRALSMLDEMKAEDNSIIRMWRDCGLKISTAADSQAVLQLKKEYCDRRDCLRCRFGYMFIKENGWFVKDKEE